MGARSAGRVSDTRHCHGDVDVETSAAPEHVNGGPAVQKPPVARPGRKLPLILPYVNFPAARLVAGRRPARSRGGAGGWCRFPVLRRHACVVAGMTADDMLDEIDSVFSEAEQAVSEIARRRRSAAPVVCPGTRAPLRGISWRCEMRALPGRACRDHQSCTHGNEMPVADRARRRARGELIKGLFRSLLEVRPRPRGNARPLPPSLTPTIQM